VILLQAAKVWASLSAFAAADVACTPLEPEYDSVKGTVRFCDFTENNTGGLGNLW
jgi:hypothetical protein